MNTEQAPNHNFSDDPETKKYVTPFAFSVAEELLGKPLASPRRRLAAVLIDLVIVALLTTMNALFLGIVMLIVAGKSFFSLRGEVGKTGVKVALALVMFVSIATIVIQSVVLSFDANSIVFNDSGISVVEKVHHSNSLEYKNNDIDDEFTLLISDVEGDDGEALCAPQFKCAQPFFDELVVLLIEDGYDYPDAKTLFSGVYEMLKQNERLESELEVLSLSQSLYKQRYERQHSSLYSEDPDVSVVAWLQGFIGDLGLSFGWAAVYFSVFTAWLKGQTIGKKLLGIKVVRIDGKRIDLWESFGRYGGYSAGVATGLLGFLQIYWDANRQAIQDKISETVVIRLH